MASTKRQRRTTTWMAGGAAAFLLAGGFAAWAEDQGPVSIDPAQAPKKLRTKKVRPTKRPTPVKRPRIDLVFALDTTGSMAGLLDGAKRKIWAIANKVVSGQPRPDVRIGLVAYRDHGDAYVTKRFPLTQDIDAVQASLLTLQANGGGDTPEHVNKALAEAIRDMEWGQGQDVLKLLFLVGDAPPQEGRDGLTSAALAVEARTKGVVINAIRCGGDGATAAVWRAISSSAGGKFASIAQDGGVVATVATPFDDRLADLNTKLAEDALAYGGAAKRARTRKKVSARMAMEPAVAAEAASFSAKSGRVDSGDLLTALMDGAVADLNEVAEDELPAEARAVPKPERKGWLKARKAKRKALEKQVLSASKRREEWLAAEESKAGGPPSDAFDTQVVDMLRTQAEAVGVAY